MSSYIIIYCTFYIYIRITIKINTISNGLLAKFNLYYAHFILNLNFKYIIRHIYMYVCINIINIIAISQIYIFCYRIYCKS